MHCDPVQMAMLGGVRDDTQTAAYMDRNLRHWDEFGFGIWMLRDRATDVLCGRTLLRHVDVDGVDEVETGYSFDPAFWGRGLATEVACACVAIGRNDLGLATVVAITRSDNMASRRVMTKAGFAYERLFAHGELPHVLYRTESPGCTRRAGLSVSLPREAILRFAREEGHEPQANMD